MNSEQNQDARNLIQAIKKGNLDEVRNLLTQRPDFVNIRIAGEPVLVKAIKSGQTEVALLLIDKGANLNWKSDGATYMHIAAQKGNIEILIKLKEKGLDVNALDSTQESAICEAICCPSAEAVLWFLENGVKLDLKDDKNMIFFNRAASWGNVEILEILESKIPHINYEGKLGEQLLILAIESNNYESALWLVSYGAVCEDNIEFKINGKNYNLQELYNGLKECAYAKVNLEISSIKELPEPAKDAILDKLYKDFYKILPDFDKKSFSLLIRKNQNSILKDLHKNNYKNLKIQTGETILEAIKREEDLLSTQDHINQASKFIAGVAVKMYSEDCPPAEMPNKKQLNSLIDQARKIVSDNINQFNKSNNSPLTYVNKDLRKKLAIGIEDTLLSKPLKRHAAIAKKVKNIIENHNSEAKESGEQISR